ILLPHSFYFIRLIYDILLFLFFFFFFFFFYCSGHHRDLHSFPTRRSSDLGHDVVVAVRVVMHDPLTLQGLDQCLQIQIARRQLRSEEHTSELQSQSNLVCRLLLEKKKKKKKNNTQTIKKPTNITTKHKISL